TAGPSSPTSARCSSASTRGWQIYPRRSATRPARRWGASMASNVTAGVRPSWDRVQWGALAVGVVALGACAVAALFRPDQFFRSYLVAFNFWLSVPLGCMAVVMLHHLIGGTWGLVIRRPLESGTRTLPLLAVLFLPLLLGLSELYLWARPDVVAADDALWQTSPYLHLP